MTTPEVSAIGMQTVWSDFLEAAEMEQIELVVNRIRIDMVKRGDMMSLEDVCEVLAIELLGAVPDDEAIVVSTNRGEPLVGSSAMAGIAYSNICKRGFLGYDVPLMTFENKTGFFQKYQVYLEDREAGMGIWDLWNRKSSKDFAKDRLKLLLVSDRAGCSSEVMELMKNDIISVISKIHGD